MIADPMALYFQSKKSGPVTEVGAWNGSRVIPPASFTAVLDEFPNFPVSDEAPIPEPWSPEQDKAFIAFLEKYSWSGIKRRLNFWTACSAMKKACTFEYFCQVQKAVFLRDGELRL